MTGTIQHYWRRIPDGRVVRVLIPDYWRVEYPPIEIKGKARSYSTSGVATFTRRKDARDFIHGLRRKYSICTHGGVDRYLRCTAFDDDEEQAATRR